MSVQQINDLTLVMQNVLPAQVYSPTEPQTNEISSEMDSEMGKDREDTGSSNTCSCVDTYA